MRRKAALITEEEFLTPVPAHGVRIREFVCAVAAVADPVADSAGGEPCRLEAAVRAPKMRVFARYSTACRSCDLAVHPVNRTIV